MIITEYTWENLLNYYIDVIQRENDNKINFLESGRNSKFYTPFDQENIYSSTTGSITIQLNPNSPLIKQLSIQKTSKTIGQWFYGYPIFRESRKSKYGNGYYSSLTPILYSEVRLRIDNNNIIVELIESNQNINTTVFKKADVSIPDIDEFDEFVSSNTEHEELIGNLSKSTKDIAQSIVSLTGFKEFSPIDHQKLNHRIPSKQDSNNYIINDAMLFFSETKTYHNSLIKELELLKYDKYFSKLKDTALYPILTQNFTNKINNNNVSTLLIAESNDSQYKAVTDSLRNKLTVVSGPPGTGKSQVVLNTISSLINSNKSGLLVSKTNAAVDIICNYYDDVFEVPILLRTGNKENRVNAVQLIENIANNLFKENISKNTTNKLNSDYNKLFKKVYGEDLKIYKKYEIADQMVILTEEYQILKEKLSDTIVKWSDLNFFSLSDCNKYLDLCSVLINENNDLFILEKEKFIKLIWGNIVNFFKNKNRTSIIRKTNELKNIIKIPKSDLSSGSNINDISEYLFQIKDSLSLYFTKVRLNELKMQIDKLPNEKSIVRKFEKHENQLLKAGRKVLESLQNEKLSCLKKYEIDKLKDFVKSQKELSAHGRVSTSRFKQLKKIEELSFPQIKNIFPVWATTSLSAKNSMFPLKDCIFDLLIIDEASQCDIASMIPLLFRAKNACIIGDINQLSNIATISDKADKAIANKNNIKDSDHFYLSYKNNSLYDIAERTLKTHNGFIKLDEHYRSHPDIINFSNKQFYGRFLKIYTNPKSLAINPGKTALEWINVKGIVESPRSGSAFNKIETEKIFEVTLDLMKKYWGNSNFISIGIVTPLRAQVEFIKKYFTKMVNELPEEDKNMYYSYTKGPIPFYIDTAYKFQGNERDILIFSPVASSQIKPGTYRFINERRQLNVSITRARAKLFIVGNKDFCKQNGGLLGSLAKYSEELLLKSTKSEDYEKRIQSPIERKFYNKLRSIGYNPIPQYSDEGFNIDFAIFQNEKKIAIEINGVSFHKSTDGNIRKDDIIRKRRLMNAGWEVKIFWSWDIMSNLDKCINDVRDFLG